MRVSVCKSFTFDAAHKLPEHDGKCRNLHGHTYKLEVEVSTDASLVKARSGAKRGMVIDFGDLKELVKREVIDVLDHTCLNDLVLPEFYPTAENLLVWMELRLRNAFSEVDEGVRLERLRLYETQDSYAEWKHELVREGARSD